MRLSTEHGVRDRLLLQGTTAFRTGGYHGTGIKEIVDRVGVPKGSFYNYFDSKEAFASAAIRRFGDELNRRLDHALEAAPDPVAGLRLFFGELTTEFETAGFRGGCLLANLGAEVDDNETCRLALRDAMRGWLDTVVAALRAAQGLGLVRADRPAAELAQLLVDGWEGAVIRMKIEQSAEPLRLCVSRMLDDWFRP